MGQIDPAPKLPPAGELEFSAPLRPSAKGYRLSLWRIRGHPRCSGTPPGGGGGGGDSSTDASCLCTGACVCAHCAAGAPQTDPFLQQGTGHGLDAALIRPASASILRFACCRWCSRPLTAGHTDGVGGSLWGARTTLRRGGGWGFRLLGLGGGISIQPSR